MDDIDPIRGEKMKDPAPHADPFMRGFVPIEGPAPLRDEERSEDVHDIPLGATVTEAETGRTYVFYGWARNTAGTYPNFVEALTPDRRPTPFYEYHAAFAETLERKFPDLIRFRRIRKEGRS